MSLFLLHFSCRPTRWQCEPTWSGDGQKGFGGSLTGAVGGLALQGHDLVLLLVDLHRQVGQVLLHLPGHLGVFVQLLGVEQRAAAHSLLVGAALHVQHVGVGAALTQRPNEGGGGVKVSMDEKRKDGGRWREQREMNAGDNRGKAAREKKHHVFLIKHLAYGKNMSPCCEHFKNGTMQPQGGGGRGEGSSGCHAITAQSS